MLHCSETILTSSQIQKLCNACSNYLLKDQFSNKQWKGSVEKKRTLFLYPKRIASLVETVLLFFQLIFYCICICIICVLFLFSLKHTNFVLDLIEKLLLLLLRIKYQHRRHHHRRHRLLKLMIVTTTTMMMTMMIMVSEFKVFILWIRKP